MSNLNFDTVSLDPTDVSKEKLSDQEEGNFDQGTQTSVPESEKAVDAWHPSQFPDGGRDAWLCLLGTFCCLFCSFGWLNCVGVFQSYYERHQLREFTSSEVAWIPSCEIFVMFLPGPFVGFFFDNHGPRYLIVFGTFFHVLGLMMTSLCKEYYQFILAQGICSALGLNCIFTAATSSITTWFWKKRGLAFGVTAAGSGLGGIILPIMVNHLIPEVGYGWAMRITAFLILGLMAVAFVCVKSRLPPRPRTLKLAHFIEPFKDAKWVVTTVSSFFFFFGLFVPISFIEVQSLASGMSTDLAGYLIPILNAASIFGRIIPGILADKVGRFNMQVIMCTITGILVLALWLPSSGNAAFITFAGLYGFASGGYIALVPAQVAYISKVEQIGIRVGVSFAVISFAGLAGGPIAGAIVTRENGSFRGMQIYAGVMLLAGAAWFLVARIVVGGLKWKKI